MILLKSKIFFENWLLLFFLRCSLTVPKSHCRSTIAVTNKKTRNSPWVDFLRIKNMQHLFGVVHKIWKQNFPFSFYNESRMTSLSYFDDVFFSTAGGESSQLRCFLIFIVLKASENLVIVPPSEKIRELSMNCDVVLASRCRFINSIGIRIKHRSFTSNNQVFLSVTSLFLRFRITFKVLTRVYSSKWPCVVTHSTTPTPIKQLLIATTDTA